MATAFSQAVRHNWGEGQVSPAPFCSDSYSWQYNSSHAETLPLGGLRGVSLTNGDGEFVPRSLRSWILKILRRSSNRPIPTSPWTLASVDQTSALKNHFRPWRRVF